MKVTKVVMKNYIKDLVKEMRHYIGCFSSGFQVLRNCLLLLSVVFAGLFFQPLAFGQADILSNLTPEQLAQFNQLPPQQRQALLNQLQLGSSAGLELPVTQPETISPRASASGNARPPSSLNQIQADIDARSTQRTRVNIENETERDRIKRKAQLLFNLGIDLVELDVYQELFQMGILAEMLTPSEFAQQEADFAAMEAQALEDEENNPSNQAPSWVDS